MSPEAWAVEWLDKVASGQATMSQRKLSTVEARGGINALKKLARERGVHLLVVVDEDGAEIVAASRHPFRIIC